MWLFPPKVRMRSNATIVQAPPSSHSTQLPASNSQSANPAQAPRPNQASYPDQDQASYVWPNQLHGGVHPCQILVPYTVTAIERATAPPPPTPPPPCNLTFEGAAPHPFPTILNFSNLLHHLTVRYKGLQSSFSLGGKLTGDMNSIHQLHLHYILWSFPMCIIFVVVVI